MDNYQKMLEGLPFRAGVGELLKLHLECQDKVFRYNGIAPSHRDEKQALLRDILGKCGDKARIESPFHCDYGFNILVGDRFFANYNLVVLDIAPVVIGDNVLLGPNNAIYAVAHPINPELRNTGYEFGVGVKIGDNVWTGGNVVIVPGVTVGSNVVIGAGSVVTRHVPDNVVVAGNPARIIREITARDREFYYKNRPVEDLIPMPDDI